MRVRDRMTRTVATTHPEVPVMAARELMQKRRLRHLPVVDQRGRLVGIITDRDLRQVVFMPALRSRLARAGELLGKMTVSDIMSRKVVTVGPGATIAEAARLMHGRKIGALPVVERGRMVGIITESDILAAFEESLAVKGARAHAPPRVGRAQVRPLARRVAEAGRYDYGFPLFETRDPWHDYGGEN
jgi:acetoin utilization protein AcuB